VTGFNQAYRSVIPESVAGASAAPTFDGRAVSVEQKLGPSTFIGVSGEIISSKVERVVGVVENAVSLGGPTFPFSASGTRENLDFRERSLIVTLNQLLGDAWSLGAHYRLSHAELGDRFPDIPSSATLNGGFQTEQQLEATMHQLNLFAIYNNPCGFFASASAIWTTQHNNGYTPARPAPDFWQFNVETGYRFAQRRAELRVGLLNLTDQGYRLNPLNLAQELPRERTLAVSFQFNF